MRIAGTPQGFAGGIDQALALRPASWRPAADDLLAGMSWDGIWAGMAALVARALAEAPGAVSPGR